MHCEITEVAHIEDVVGYPCNNDASAKCSDCGAQVCDAHAVATELLFCQNASILSVGWPNSKRQQASEEK